MPKALVLKRTVVQAWTQQMASAIGLLKLQTGAIQLMSAEVQVALAQSVFPCCLDRDDQSQRSKTDVMRRG